MGKGNRPMRVADEFRNLVSDLQKQADQTSAQITKDIASIMKRIK